MEISEERRTHLKVFAGWMQEELEKRQWTQAKLAQEADVTPSALSSIVQGNRDVSRATAGKVAMALGYDPTVGWVKAGYADEGGDAEPSLARLLAVARQMSTEERRELLDFAVFKLNRRDEEE